MNVFDAVLLALRQVWAQKLKSFFTLLGVIVGVTFLISVFAVVEGMNRYVEDDFAGSISAGCVAAAADVATQREPCRSG